MCPLFHVDLRQVTMLYSIINRLIRTFLCMTEVSMLMVLNEFRLPTFKFSHEKRKGWSLLITFIIISIFKFCWCIHWYGRRISIKNNIITIIFSIFNTNVYDDIKLVIDVIVFLKTPNIFCFKSAALENPSANSRWILFRPLWCDNNTGGTVHSGSIKGSSL
jgi:hypothetical protein